MSPVMVSDPVAWSTSLSFERTITSTAVLRAVASMSSLAIGVSFTQVMANDPVAMLLVAPDPSSTW